jgi:serine/threonine-protein kinase
MDQTQVVTRQARPTTVLPPVARGAERRRRRWLAGIVIALIVVGGLVALFFLLFKSIVGSPTQVRVPDVSGSTVAAAQHQLKSDGFKIGKIKHRASEKVFEGLVIATDPPKGSKVDQGSTVDLIVSTGKPQVAVPDVRGKSVEEATAILEGRGFHVDSSATQPSDTVQAGFVIDQNPKPDQKVDKDSTVHLIVSAGAPQAVVPFVVCQTLDDAQARIEAAHLRMQQVGNELNLQCPDPNMVARQVPDAGTQVNEGSVVKVYASEPSPTPSPSPSPSATPTPSIP